MPSDSPALGNHVAGDAIVVTGVGVISALGLTMADWSAAFLAGQSGVIDLSSLADRDGVAIHPAQTRGDVAIGAPIVGFDAKQYVRPRKALKVMCREIQTAYAAAEGAVEASGLRDCLPSSRIGSVVSDDEAVGDGLLARNRVGTVFGSEMFYGPPEELVDAFARCIDESGVVHNEQFGAAAIRDITPLWMLKYLPNMPACHVGIALDITGPNNTVTLGDVSGHAAIAESVGLLRRGIADAVVTAAVGTRINQTRAIFSEDTPLAAVAEDPTRSSRPHAADATGLVRGEAAGAIILETLAAAEKRGATPLVEVVASASRFFPSPGLSKNHRTADLEDHSRGSVRAIELAIDAVLQSGGVSADQIGAVVGHGFGDRSVDAAEAAALRSRLPGVPLSLPAALVGHVGAATGMIGVIAGIAMLQSGTVAPVPHAADCDTSLSVSDQPRPLTKPLVLVIAHTTAGAATAVLLRGM